MFGSGQQHRLNAQQKAAPPPVPPPKQSQPSIAGAFAANPINRYNAPQMGSKLKPSHGPSLNTVLSKNNPPAPQPQGLKPKATVVKAFDNSSSFVDGGYHSMSPSLEPQTQMSALHEAVFFDEGDFDDDGDLDFDDSIVHDPANHSFDASPNSLHAPSPPPSALLHKEQCEPTPPTKRAHGSIIDSLPTKTTKSNMHPQLANSSAPLPWSSSPTEHLGFPAGPTPRVPIETIDLVDENEAPKKRRKVPWVRNEAISAPRQPTVPTTQRRKVSSSTLFSKPSPMPWDATASDIKKASRQKAEQKRSMITKAEKTTKKGLRQKKLMLSTEQMHVLDLVLNSKKSVFFTGSAGTGKSVLMREVIASLRGKYGGVGAVAVTASTGLAACNISGVTLHSFAGIGLGKEPVPDLVKRIKRNAKAKNRWINTRVLVIDEISMVDGELFDKLEAIARLLRNNGRPFGGIQLVITGDFFQLPPVPDQGKVARFAFDADSWTTTIEHTIGLTQVFRQKDPEFASILNEMRLGRLCPESVAVFKRLTRPLTYNDGIEPTELFPTRQEVDAANRSKMFVLTGESQEYMADDTGTIIDKGFRDKLLSNCMAPPRIELKLNSQVMLIKNIDETLVNGSLGRVVDFMDEKNFDRLLEEGESTSTKVESKTTAKLWPLVEFVLPDGMSRQLLVQPEQWKVELPSGEVQACRSQIPLILAWALSIHKAQGQTLERVKVDLGKVFEKGQAYVALSRATCQEGLQVLRFDASKVMAHEKVRTFYESLYSAAEAKSKKTSRTEEFLDDDENSKIAEGSY